jgi:outer membrane protein assembly factor BamB
VYVTTANTDGTYRNLYAIDQQTGRIVWVQPLPGVGQWSAAAYDAGRIFVVERDVVCCGRGGFIDAFDATTGAPLWTTKLPGGGYYSSPPTAANGVVYTSNDAGTLFAVDELTGSVVSTAAVFTGDISSPALSSTGVFVSYACDQSYGFAQQSLAPLWHDYFGCWGGGGKTAAYSDGQLFIRDATSNLILDAATGNVVRSFTPPNSPYIPPLAVDSTTIFALITTCAGFPFLCDTELTAQDRASGVDKWTFGGDGSLDTAPIVVSNPDGEWVIEGSSSGNLYAVNEKTGVAVWSTHVAATIPAPDEQNATLPPTGLAAGEGLLVVPSGNVLTAYAATKLASVTLTPPDAVNTVGTSHTVTASVSNTEGGPVSSSYVLFSVQGSVTTTGTCQTDANGQCSFTYQGPQLPGADVITACADANGNGSVDAAEPCATATKAWLLPTATAGHVTGGGQVLNATGTDSNAFGFTAQSDSNGVKGERTLVDPAAGVKVKCLDVTALTESGTHATLFGHAVINGSATTYRIDVDDLGEPGTGHDTFKIQTGGGYATGGVITNGNIQVH